MKLRHPWTQRSSCSSKLALLASLCFAFISTPRASAVPPESSQANITFAGGGSLSVRGKEQFPRVGILSGETAAIQLQLPPGLANLVVGTEAMDGGVVSPNVVIASDGTGFLAFRVGVRPGLYRVLLSAPGWKSMLQFYVPQPGTPPG